MANTEGAPANASLSENVNVVRPAAPLATATSSITFWADAKDAKVNVASEANSAVTSDVRPRLANALNC